MSGHFGYITSCLFKKNALHVKQKQVRHFRKIVLVIYRPERVHVWASFGALLQFFS